MITATAAIIRKNGKYLIAKRKMDGVVGGKWEFPGGKTEVGESPQECLRRELMEELGINAEVGSFFDGHMHNYKKGKMLVYAYNIVKFEGRPKLREHLQFKWVTPQEMKDFKFVYNDKPIIKKLTKA